MLIKQNIVPTLVGVLLFGAASGNALAQDRTAALAWAEMRAQEMMAAPVTLENASQFHWYQILPSDLEARGLSHLHPSYATTTGRALSEYGLKQLSVLQEQLNERFATTGLPADENATIDHCGWIAKRPQSALVTGVQGKLLSYCRQSAAPALIKRLLIERAAKLEIGVANLKTLDLSLPRSIIGEVAAGSLGEFDAAYGAAVSKRLAETQEAVAQEIRNLITAQAYGGGSLRPTRVQCGQILGSWFIERDGHVGGLARFDTLRLGRSQDDAKDTFARALSGACQASANNWLLDRQPTLIAEVKNVFARVNLGEGTLIPVEARCDNLLRRWFDRLDSFDQALTGPVWQVCEKEAAAFNSRSIDARIASLKGIIASAPRSLEGLEKANWFELPDSVSRSWVDPFGVGSQDLQRMIGSRFEMEVGTTRREATQNALDTIRSVYADAASDEQKVGQAVALCGPYLDPKNGGRMLPPGGGKTRAAIQEECRRSKSSLAARLCDQAITQADPDGTFGASVAVPAPGGRLISVDLRRLVCASAADGIRVAFTISGLIFKTHEVRISPWNKSAPSLKGTLEKMARPDGVEGWRVTKLESLPGLDGPLATLSCLTMSASDAGAVTTAAALGGLAAALFDAPDTAERLFGGAIDNFASAAACAAAKTDFLGAR
jgi:hypothetical protein